ncbi:hypothetical protein [Aurantiacibacter rhizosphaerae]|uniref:2,4-diaminopentanoate dehydrogenase C-terminal domain-containing protein n=1 Tax=Aurantiacibacter rhizosphaerae TaxID=2691582 RepID=A0A844XHJ0_9SPHN|nr:hypothetical protein [Aurantiacibacter rhizosphaerae]MWV29290.1 hypothetical protein [Aurantiacibacter rhizosphaerae]
MRDPYKVVVWGPGGLGTACIYEIAQREDIELVGVRCFNPEKSGTDAGTLIGIDPMGVTASDDKEAVAAIECDAIIFTPRDLGNYNNDEELLWLLRSGRNIITVLPYQHVRLTRDEDFVKQLEAACEEGGSVFHATGVDPDVISDRVLAGLTGFCNDITRIKLQENWDFQFTPPETMALCGFAKTPEEARAMPVAAIIADNFLTQVCRGVGHSLGVEYSRVENTNDYITTDKEIVQESMNIPAGTVGRVTHRCKGYVGDATEPFFEVEVNWHSGADMLPEGTEPDQYWVIDIEGRPSIKTTVDIKASLETRSRFIPIGDMNSEPGYHATIAPCLQALPVVANAKPGILPVTLPQMRWMPDYRQAEAN